MSEQTMRIALERIKAIAESELGVPVVIPPVDPPPPPPPPQPPPPPVGPVGNPRLVDLGGAGNNKRLALFNGEVVYISMPTQLSGTAQMGEVPGTPQPRHLEICVSKQPGLIDPSHPNYVITDNIMSAVWMTGPMPYSRGEVPDPKVTPEGRVRAMGYMWAPLAEGPWYVNYRATFDAALGEFLVGWNNGPF